MLVSLSLSGLANIYLSLPGSSALAGVSFLLLCVGILPSFGVRETVLAGMAIFLASGLLMRGEGYSDVILALDRAAFFAAFIYLVTLLKEAAVRSASVVALGTWLTRQRADRRYYALAFGGHGMGVVLNFGAISLITPLIQRGVARLSDVDQRATLERRQLSALIRGFSWMIMWSPTALTQAVLFTSFPDVNLPLVMMLGISASLVMILIGRLEERWFGGVTSFELEQDDTPNFPRRAFIRFAFVCCVLIGSAGLMMQLASVSAAIALMLIAPLLMIAWIFSQVLQVDRHNTLKRTTIELSEVIVSSSSVQGRSAFTLGAAAFIGEAAAHLAPIDSLALHMHSLSIPDWVFLMSLPVVITLCGQIALSPLLVVVFLSSVINQLPELPADASLIVFALGAGWALSMSASPNASATLLMSGVTGIAPTTLTWRWNGRYAFMCMIVFFISFFWLTRFIG